MILSASRRTDIPGFYSDWFVNRLREGYVLTKNPMNPNQVSRINLSAEKIDCIVFWTKDAARMMEKLPIIDKMGYSYYFQFTLTPYGKEIERNLRDKEDILKTFRQLSELLGKERVLWRYDPIILTETFNEEYHANSFRKLCDKLQGYTDICTISFVDLYGKLRQPVKKGLIKEINEEQMHRMAALLVRIAAEYGIELRACCEKLDLSMEGVRPAACIDKEVVERICGHSISIKKDRNQRIGCGCMQSVDIGVYNTCRNGCVYCYANHSDAAIENNFNKHDPHSDILIGYMNGQADIIERN